MSGIAGKRNDLHRDCRLQNHHPTRPSDTVGQAPPFLLAGLRKGKQLPADRAGRAVACQRDRVSGGRDESGQPRGGRSAVASTELTTYTDARAPSLGTCCRRLVIGRNSGRQAPATVFPQAACSAFPSARLRGSYGDVENRPHMFAIAVFRVEPAEHLLPQPERTYLPVLPIFSRCSRSAGALRAPADSSFVRWAHRYGSPPPHGVRGRQPRSSVDRTERPRHARVRTRE